MLSKRLLTEVSFENLGVDGSAVRFGDNIDEGGVM